MSIGSAGSTFQEIMEVQIENKSHLLTELLHRASSLDEMLEEAKLSLQVARGEQPQVHDHVV